MFKIKKLAAVVILGFMGGFLESNRRNWKKKIKCKKQVYLAKWQDKWLIEIDKSYLTEACGIIE